MGPKLKTPSLPADSPSIQDVYGSNYQFLLMPGATSLKLVWPVGIAVKNITLGVEGRWLVSRAGQIALRVANGSPPLRCFFGAVLYYLAAEMGQLHALA